jgi:hypothetical protein
VQVERGLENWLAAFKAGRRLRSGLNSLRETGESVHGQQLFVFPGFFSNMKSTFAATALGFPSVKALQVANPAFCDG